MQSTFGQIETLLRGLRTQQGAIDVLTHNIANANTDGFSRQRVQLETTAPYSVPAFNRSGQAGQIGTGVTVAEIRRVRDELLDGQYRHQLGLLGGAEAQVSIYGRIEAIFNEPTSSGINAALDRFWASWQALTNHPSDMATRHTVVEESANLASTINQTRRQLDSLQSDLAHQTHLLVDEVNDLARAIGRLNAEIVAIQGVGQQPNDLLDTRDRLLDRLGKLIKTTAIPAKDGSMSVFIGGRALINREIANTLELSASPTPGVFGVTWQRDGQAAPIGPGTVSGLVEAHNEMIPELRAEIATLSETLASQVNALHRSGYGLNDPAGNPANRDFFLIDSNRDLRVNPIIESDPASIAAASQAGTPGDAAQASAIADLQHAPLLSNNSTTIGDYYGSLIAQIGASARQAGLAESSQALIVGTLDRRRQETSGVSLDEEAADLIRYQHAYQAAARAMTAVDQMLERLINDMGIVGR